MSIGDIKDMFKSFTKFWLLSPEAIIDTCQGKRESQEDYDESATTSLSIHRHYYKK
ncbi:MAG: hypothetical protein U9P50_00220 [Patescibacteria group bacterium]|nr:hypothetical protein [Patescibacteria group bacterium]